MYMTLYNVNVARTRNRSTMLRKFLPGLIIASLLLVMYGESQEILESPVENQTVPLGSNATFSCRTIGVLVWKVDGAQIIAQAQIVALAEQKIYITGGAPVFDDSAEQEHSSAVVITGTRENNGTMLWCLAAFDLLTFDVMSDPPGILYTFDHPEVPSMVEVVPIGPLQLNLSWEAPATLLGVEITYIVQATDLDTGNISSSEVESEYYIFKGSRRCEEYLFSVIAVNDAGRSGNSQEVNGSVPDLPDVSKISESLGHSVHIEDDEVYVEISFMMAQSCDGYRVQRYFLVVRSSNSEAEVPIVPTEDSMVVIILNSSLIQENIQYSIKVIAFNEIGNTTSNETDVFTTDVQYTEVSSSGNIVNISCQFASGSKALGCQIDLVPRFTNESIVSHRIERTGNNVSVVIMTEFPSSCYDLIVYDWESDNTTGELAVPLDVYWSDMVQKESCFKIIGEDPLKPESDSGTSLPLQTIVIAGGAGGGVIVCALFVCITLMVMYIVKKTKRRRRKHISSLQVTTNWEDFPSKSMSPPCAQRSDSQTTQVTVVELKEPPIPPIYDSIQNYKPRQESVTASEMEYNTLNRSDQLSSLHVTTQQPNGAPHHDPDYAHLNQAPVYQLLERNSKPVPVEVQPQYSEITDLHVSRSPLPEAQGNDYSEIPSAGTTIY